ncbi:MAG: Processing protease [Parcubacteria group bacterium GW2011_GWA2_39_18]|nr:MAG: Processing protease [Parcubacteria group bacterium GW2011_GWA2_39_18]
MSEKRQWVRLEAGCGAPIFVWYVPGGVSVALGAMVQTGSCDETWPKEAGIAHAYEHMFFQGTERFKNSKQMTKLIESCGGGLNANTGHERTFFFCELPISCAERGMIYLSEGLLKPKFTSKSIKTEMQNIVQEIKKSENDPDQYSDQIFTATIYGNHPIAKDVLGTEESVSGFAPEDFLVWENKFYYPENFVFVCAGGLEPEKVKSLIDIFFEPTPSCKKMPHVRNVSVDLVGPTQKYLFVPKNDWRQAHVWMGTTITDGQSPEVLALNFFTNMLGGMSGPLFQEVRDKRGLAYAVHSSVCPLKLLSSLQVFVGTDPAKHKEAIKIVRMVIDKNKGSKCLFDQTKVRVLGQLAIAFDKASPVARISLAVNGVILHGRPRTFEDKKSEIESITLDQVEAAVDKYLNPDRLTVVVVGPETK